MILKQFLTGIKEIVYPSVCRCCGKKLNPGESFICSGCLSGLPVSGQYVYPKELNFVRKKLENCDIDNCCCYFLYDRNSKYSNIIKEIKFGNDTGLGKFMGKMFGEVLAAGKSFIIPDLVIPIPLHRKRLRKRGYNQSEIIASAISESLGSIMCSTALERTKNTLPQSLGKNGAERRINVYGAFRVTDAEMINGKHILLVDDVITTGETIKSAISCLKENCTDIRISVAALSSVK